MTSIISNVDSLTICSFITKEQVSEYRTDLSSPQEALQGCARLLKKDIFVAPHKHLPVVRTITGTQEAWIVVEGKLLATVYDIDDLKLSEVEISSGGAIIFYRGGHSLTALEDNTIFYEFKNGPYFGYENDKKSIG